MIGKWFTKMKEVFFGEEILSQENYKEETKKSSGRIINSQYNVEPKVIHRYPEGKFRFPVIPDEEFQARHRNKPALQQVGEKRKINSAPVPKQRASYNSDAEDFSKREKFTGRNFKARDIPSPVYGFGERTLFSNKESDEAQAFNQQDQPEEIDVVKMPPVHMDFDEVESVVTNHQEELSVSEEFVSDSEEVVSGSASVVSGSASVVSDSEVHVSGSEEFVSDSAVHVSGSEEVVSGSEEFVSGSTVDTTRTQSTAPQVEQKNYVPFNVMMLKKDRRTTQERGNGYQFPQIHLLQAPTYSAETDAEWLTQQKELLQSTLQNFNVKAAVIGAVQGPAVTRLEVQPSPGVKVSKITNLSDDIKLSLSARDIRIEAPIPGRNAVGIEVPNLKSRPVPLREIIQSKEFKMSDSPLTVALGLDISGQPVVTDLQKMPHGLIAGATGSGKSVCINSILISLFYKADPDEVKLLLVDPKMVELAPYNRIPHLVTPVITDAKEATNALKWTVDEMERRYEEFSHTGVRDIKRFNQVAPSRGKKKLPYIVVIIDELADLMMVSPHDVEEAICRIAQKARACGIHLLLATQRPSVDVITGLIKANIPTRTAFSVSSQVDSRTIIDTAGAEKLLGKGDMLFLGNGTSKPVRIQGTFVSDEEIERITSYLRKQREPEYLFEKEILVQQAAFGDFEDDLFLEACEFVLEQGAASSSALQRRFRIGFNRAARLVEMMEAKGIVSEAMGSKPRNVLISKEEYEEQVLEH